MAKSTITPEQKSLINEFMSLNIEAEQFAAVMSQKYDYYYNNGDDYSYNDVELFDALLSQRGTPIRNFIDEVCKARMDIMSSDRECAAFIAAIHYFVYENRPANDTTPAVVPDSLLEEYTKAGCTFGRIKDTKYIQVVHVNNLTTKQTIIFLYKGSRKGAFEEVKKQFAGFNAESIDGNQLNLWYDNCKIIAHCQQLDAAGLKAAAINWAVRRTAFPEMPLQLPAITESAIYEAAARIRANYEAMKAEQQQPAANTLPAWLFVGAEVMTKGGYMYNTNLRCVWVDGERMTVEEINDDWVSLKRRENGFIVSSLSMKLEKAIKELSPAAGEDEQPKTIKEQPKATEEQPAPLSVKKADTPHNQKSDMLQDWGEKIGGARKDEAQPHNNNGATITAPAKTLKYGLTCRDKVNEEGEKITRWYLKVSPTRYSMSVYIDMPFIDISTDIFRLGDESTEKAEKAFMEKYPNFDNYYKFDIFQIGFNKEYIVEAKRVKIRVATFDNLKAARDYMNTDRPAADLAAIKANQTPEEKKKRAGG